MEQSFFQSDICHTKHNLILNHAVMLIAKFAGLHTCFQLGDELINCLAFLLFTFPELIAFEDSVLSRVDIILKLFL